MTTPDERLRKRLRELNQPVPPAWYTGRWLYEGGYGLLTPEEHLAKCEDVSDDEDALYVFSRSTLIPIEDED